MACIVFTFSLKELDCPEAREIKKRRGKINKKDEATKNMADPHPMDPIRIVAIGAPANIPADAAAVPRPIIKLLCFEGPGLWMIGVVLINLFMVLKDTVFCASFNE